jgi:hypothetical protein
LAQQANAQVDDHKFEAGVLFTSITLENFRERVLPGFSKGNSTVRGIGGRFAVNFTKHLALDTEGTFFPETRFGNSEFGQKLQGFAGIKAGVRNKRVGVFAKARPGVMWFGEFSSLGSCQRTSFGSTCGVAHEKDFALDLGGVVEFYPFERAIIRVDAGDTIVRLKAKRFGSFSNLTDVPAATTNNFQATIGFGWRF